MCKNNSHCGCHLNRCSNLGPFTAVDRDCMLEPPVHHHHLWTLPFSGGTTKSILSSRVADGSINQVSLVSFGTAYPKLGVSGSTITLVNEPNEAFTVSQASHIKAIAATFVVTSSENFIPGERVTIHATVYRAPAGMNVFTATSATVDLAPSLTGTITPDFLVRGFANVHVPVQVGDRLVMVFSVTTTSGAADKSNTIDGFASAGLTMTST